MKKLMSLLIYVLIITITIIYISFNKLTVYSQQDCTQGYKPLENVKMVSLEKDSTNLKNDSIGNIIINRLQQIKVRLSFSLLEDEVIYMKIPMFESPIERDKVIYNIDNVMYSTTNKKNDFTINDNCIVFNNSTTPLSKGTYTIDISINIPDFFTNPKGFIEGDKLISNLKNITIYKFNKDNPSMPYKEIYSPNITETDKLKIYIATSIPVIKPSNMLGKQKKYKDIIKLNITDKQSKIVQYGFVKWNTQWNKHIISTDNYNKINYIKKNNKILNLLNIINIDKDSNNDNIQLDFHKPYRFEIISKYIPVTQNGTYILYAKDASGIESYEVIIINGILENIPNLT